MQNEPVISLKGVVKSYGSFTLGPIDLRDESRTVISPRKSWRRCAASPTTSPSS
jgi:hypothetical protein